MIAEKNEVGSIDNYSDLTPLWDDYSADGVHLTQNGHEAIAKKIMTGIE